MISKETEAEIVRLYHGERWPIGTIAGQLGLHHTTVQRVLRHTGVDAKVVAPRPSMVDPFVPFIVEQLGKYPDLRSSRLFVMIKERGYPGGPDHLRRVIGRLRPKKPAEAFQRLRTMPGEQAQVDWAHFGKLEIGRASRPLWAFVMVLSYSRRLFLRFFPGASMPFFVRGHVQAFADFGGVPRVLLYDNLKSAVIERHGDAIRFHPTLLAMSAHYRFEPRPVAVARGNEKGRVERAIRYIREAFFAARSFTDLADLNRQAAEWTATAAVDRSWVEDRSRTVRQAFEDERGVLLTSASKSRSARHRTSASISTTTPFRTTARGARSSSTPTSTRCASPTATTWSPRMLAPGTELSRSSNPITFSDSLTRSGAPASTAASTGSLALLAAARRSSVSSPSAAATSETRPLACS
jgi:transposase